MTHANKLTFMVLSNLNIAAFDSSGQQVPELQRSIPCLLAEQMEKYGYDPEGCIISTRDDHWKLFRTEDGWNRRHIETIEEMK